ncbi:hypothetical protein GCM10010435_23520 [Winogradskya consettensis]|uniref:Uncharacterized protein n=1 Tax=Winogradskya consettensis TaxID=113560 RepID=A0A919SPZ3_9ACTN|nr:hypothetical protein Aco04nite_45230 [Actinoplanes consettensis]
MIAGGAGVVASRQDEPVSVSAPAEVTSAPPAEALTRLDDGLGITGGHEGLQALVRGAVQLVDGCFLLAGDVVIWPHGTHATGDEITLPDGATLKVGDTVQGAGGYYQADYQDLRLVSDSPTVHRVVSCSRRTNARSVAVFNSYSYGPIRRDEE